MTFLNGYDMATIVERRPECKPWCVDHAMLDDGTPFCNAPDLPIAFRAGHRQGTVALTCFPNEEPHILLELVGGPDSMRLDEAELVAKQVLRQVARARGEAQ